MDLLKQLLGRLHPLLVHLPIGFIVLGLLLQWYDRKTGQYRKIIGLIYLWGGTSAVLACITGYLQYLGEGYAFETVKWHLWLGIVTAVFSFLMYFKFQEPLKIPFFERIPVLGLTSIIFLLISYTGHLGGSITHGEDFLVEPLPNSIKSALGFETFEEKVIVLDEKNWKNALIYEDIINPILNNKCISCHNPKKIKGELQLHTKEAILKGGENGEIISVNNAEESELFIRMNLPKEDDDHMPPKDKTQPTAEEVRLIKAWIDEGHPFDKTIGETGMKKELFSSFFPQKSDADYPDLTVVAIATDTIRKITQQGIHVDNISEIVSFLYVSCINKPSFSDTDFEILLPIKDQVAILDLGGTQITDAIFEKLTMLPHLTILKLDNTDVSGKNIELLSGLEHLKSINLTSTDFEKIHLQKLSGFKKLKKVYVYKTNMGSGGPKTLNNGQTTINYGNYDLPLIASDSIVY